MRTFFRTLLLFFILITTPSLAYHFPWDQGHDTTDHEDPSDPAEKGEGPPCGGKRTTSPVYIKTGHFVWSDSDVVLTGKPSIGLNRTYTSHEPRSGLFGNGWISNIEDSILETSDNNETSFQYRLPSGLRYEFKEVNGTIELPKGFYFEKVERIDSETLKFSQGKSYKIFKNGQLKERVNRVGEKITLEYDPNGALTQIRDENGRTLDFTYSANGFVSTVTDHTGRAWNYTYDSDGNLVAVTNPKGDSRTYEYVAYSTTADAQVYHHLTKVTDESGKVVTTVTYSGEKVSSYTEGENRYTYNYQNSTNAYKTDSQNSRYSFIWHESSGIVTKRTSPLNTTTELILDGNLSIIGEIDQSGNQWNKTLDSKGRTLTTTSPLGQVTQYQYSGENPNPVKIISPLGYTTTMTYDSNYNLLTATNPKGNSATMEYDAKGNVVAITDAKGAKTEITYNGNSLPTSTKDALGRTTTFTYDSLGRKVSQTDPAGKTTQFTYDDLDRVTKIANALGHTIEYSYDEVGRVLSIKDPVGNETKYEYDDYGRLSKETRPDGKFTTYTYRNDNLVASINRYDGKTVSFNYDANKRVTSQTVGSDTVNYTYNALNLITQVRNSTATIDYTYDTIGRVTKESVNGVEVDRTYDEENSIKTLSFLGKTVSYSRDNLGLATTIANGSDSFGFSYDKNSYLTQIALPNGVNESYSFNSVGELTQIASSVANLAYEYDTRGLISKKSIGSDVFNYGYDDIGRLTSENANSFAYDIAGNNLNANASYNTQNNQMVGNDNYGFEYDSSGNVVKKTDKSTDHKKLYTFNDRNQLIQVVTQDENNQTTKTLAFSYDPVGRRYSKSVNGVVQKFIYDGMDMVAMVDDSNNIISTITHSEGIDQPLSISDGTDTYYYLRDHQGSVIALVDSSGAKVEEYSYDAYGKVTSKNITATTYNPYGYTGRIMDDDDLYYYRARYYDPTTQRFLSEDPIGFDSEDFNFYRYVGNNPTNNTDSSGLVLDTIADITFVLYDLYSIGRDNIFGNCGNLGTNLAALSADTAAIFVPFATGGGIAVRATTKVATKSTKVAGKITGYTKHGLNQAISRNGGRGVSAKHMLDAVKNPKKVVSQSRGRIKYQGKKATVILNKDGKIITTYGKSRGKKIWNWGKQK